MSVYFPDDALRRRWMRPNAHLYLRPDAARYLKPGAEGYDPPPGIGYRAPAHYRLARDEAALAEAKAVAAQAERDERVFRYELAALRFELQLLKLSLRGAKANFDPAQPRDDEGRWTDAGLTSNDPFDDTLTSEIDAGDDGNAEEFSAARRKPDGHHYVPKGELNKRNVSEEAQQVFAGAKTGELYDRRSNKWDGDHRVYSAAVGEALDAFFHKNGISPDKMTADQAREFLGQVLESRDPRIRSFNMTIQIREIMRRLFRRTGRE